MNSNKSVTANFTSTPTCTYTLSVGTNPYGGGTVGISPQKSAYCAGDVVTLAATPYSAYTFSFWSGDAGGSINPITITMNSNKSVTANFTSTPTCTYTLSVGTNPPGGGTVTISPPEERLLCRGRGDAGGDSLFSVYVQFLERGCRRIYQPDHSCHE